MSDARQQLNEMIKFRQLMEDVEPECPYCDDEEPLDGVACLNCGSKQFVGEETGDEFIDDFESKLADNNPCMYCDGEDDDCEVCHGKDEMFEDPGHSIKAILSDDEITDLLTDLDREGDIVYGASYFDKLYFHFLDTHPDEIPVGSRTGRPDDVDGYVLDNLERDYGPELQSMIDRQLNDRRHGMNEGDPDDTDWDAHWAREDGDDERADDLEADAEFARMDDEMDEDKHDEYMQGDKAAYRNRDERELYNTCADDEMNSAILGPKCEQCGRFGCKCEPGSCDCKQVDEAKDDECTRCFGLGRHPGRGGEDCPECHGTGKCPKVEEDLDPDGMGHYEVVVRRGTLSGGDDNVHEDVVSGPLPLDQARNVARSHVRQIRSESETGSKVKKGYLPTQESWAIRFNSHRAGESAGAFVFIRQAEDADVEAWFGENIELTDIVESVLEEFPGQPKDYADEYDDPDDLGPMARGKSDIMKDMGATDMPMSDYEQDEIDPEYEDSELGLRFD